MKICLFIVCLAGAMTQHVLAQKNIPNYDHSLLLETKSDTTANVSPGDFDGDGHLDILLVKGRHWPIIDRVLLGDGRGGIRKAYNLGTIADRSYTGGVADFNGDGFPDIAVSNDNPDRKLVYFNDGKGNFTLGSEFGRPEWPTRNLAVADINGDGFPDLILANRGDSGNTSNYICLNNGKGQFDSACIAFAPYPATTIYPVDINKDGFIDLVVPHRDGGQSYVYLGNADRTYSDARRIPFGPVKANIRMAAAADFNGDGLVDIVTIDEFKGVDLYFGQKDQTFSAGISLADSKIVPYALTIADLNNDKKMDIIVGHIEAPSTAFFNDGMGRFKSISFGDSKGTVYGFAVGDFNEDGIPDIAAARSEGPNVLYFGSNNSTANAAISQPPIRDPHTPGYVSATELPDGTGPSPGSNGNFIIGPTHDPAPEASVQANVPQGTVFHFTMDSKDSKFYPGIAREPNTFGTPDPADPAKLVVTTSHPAPYTRQVAVYVPKQYVAGTAAPFIVGADGPDNLLFTVLDNLIAEGKVPPMIAISIGNGSGDAQGSERGLEYDAMNGVYAEFVETEVLPLVESKCRVKLTKDPAGRATMGGSSGGSCALIMAWYHPELYHRVLTYSGTYINQQWPFDPKTPHGAWEFHEHLIPESPVKPLRIWMEVGDQDLYNPNVMRDGMHDWVLANENMAKVLAAKGYSYQYVFARNARHVDRNVRKQTLPEALEWLWKDYHN